MSVHSFPYGDGTAARKIADLLLEVKPTTATHVATIDASVDLSKDLQWTLPPKPVPVQPLTLKELLALPSAFPANGDGEGKNGYTAIVASYKRPYIIHRILDAIMNQTVAPQEVWVSVFASPFENETRAAVESYTHPLNIPVKLVMGKPQLKYWARFQLGLQAPTKYTVYFDDDCLPGSNALRNFLHVQNVKDGEYRGLYGKKGHVSPVQDADNRKADYIDAWQLEPERITRADVVGGIWFVETRWVELLWHETPVSYLTGEDFHLTYVLQKYGDIPTYVFPVDKADPTSLLHSPDYWEISAAGDTTQAAEGNAFNAAWLREHLSRVHFQRGTVRARTPEMWRPNEVRVLFLVDSIDDAKAFTTLHSTLSKVSDLGFKKNEKVRMFPVLTGRSPQKETLAQLGLDWDVEKGTTDVFDLEISTHFYGTASRPSRDVDVATSVMMGFRQVLENVQPHLVVVHWPFEGQNVAAVAAASTANFNAFPVVGWNGGSAPGVHAGAVSLGSNASVSGSQSFRYGGSLVSALCSTTAEVRTILEHVLKAESASAPQISA
ncbi:hypothetical protein HKX48_006375 [Thoreauomyces humboldtii]|nr:hypothetical protein HKX48_006375 [Thoreauomyces humboldtii]